jgi:hypothetical protein
MASIEQHRRADGGLTGTYYSPARLPTRPPRRFRAQDGLQVLDGRIGSV